MRNKLTLSLLALLLCLPFQALGEPAPPPESASSELVVVGGIVVDAVHGQPLEGVYIKQQDSLNAGFSQVDGRFELRLMRGFPQILVFSREGYEPIALPFQHSLKTLRIQLHPLNTYRPTLAPAHSSPAEAPNSRLFGNQFTLFYQMNYSLLADQKVHIQGFALNEMGLDTDLLLFYPQAIRGRFYRGRLPVDVANFPFQPAFFVNTLQAKLGTGWIQDLNPQIQLYLGGDLLFHNQSPDNRSSQDQSPVPFTGSILDFEQNRLALGSRATLAWKLSNQFTLFPDLGLYPVGVNFVRNRSSSTIDYLLAGELGLKGRYEIMPGIYAVGNYHTQLWYGLGANYLNNVHFFHLGVSVDPWTMAARLQ